MILVDDRGELTFFRMARRLAGRPVYWTGAYLAKSVLVDCGPPVTAGALLRLLEGRRLQALVVTHHHEDHTGAAALLGARRGLVARLHPAGVPLVERGFAQELYSRLAWGRPARVRARALEGDVEVDGLVLRPVPTPGHSPDHVCYFEPHRGWLFTGDLFLAERLRYFRDDEDLGAIMCSLETVCALPLTQVLCAHRGPVADGPAALRRKLDGLRALRERIRELLAAGLPETEIARRVVGREGALTWLSRGRFSARNFVRAVAREDAPQERVPVIRGHAPNRES